MRDGYAFIGKRGRALGSAQIFKTRLLLKPTICLAGPDAARLFYDESLFRRAGAAPEMLRSTLIGDGGVQTLDGDEHRHRKDLFLSLLGPQALGEILTFMDDEWAAAKDRWPAMRSIRIQDQAEQMLARSAIRWARVPIEPERLPGAWSDLVAMIEGAGAGLRHLRGRIARRRAESWTIQAIEGARRRRTDSHPGSAFAMFVNATGSDGAPVDSRTAAVELLNVLRPTVAVARYVSFLAMALQSYPAARRALEAGAIEPEWFVQEVRRFYPFFPFVAATTTRAIRWEGWDIPANTRTLLDIYGTNRDVASWPDPNAFDPARFRGWQGDPFRLIPQGGGDHATGHRCPGEWLTIELMKRALGALQSMRYDVPPQDLRMPLSRVPAIPKSRFVIQNVRADGPAGVSPRPAFQSPAVDSPPDGEPHLSEG